MVNPLGNICSAHRARAFFAFAGSFKSLPARDTAVVSARSIQLNSAVHSIDLEASHTFLNFCFRLSDGTSSTSLGFGSCSCLAFSGELVATKTLSFCLINSIDKLITFNRSDSRGDRLLVIKEFSHTEDFFKKGIICILDINTLRLESISLSLSCSRFAFSGELVATKTKAFSLLFFRFVGVS